MLIKDQSSATQKVLLFSFYLFGKEDAVALDVVGVNNDHVLALDSHNLRVNK